MELTHASLLSQLVAPPWSLLPVTQAFSSALSSSLSFLVDGHGSNPSTLPLCSNTSQTTVQ